MKHANRQLSVSEERVRLIVQDAIEDKGIPNRLELRLTVGIGLLGGQVAAAGLTAWLVPAQQVHAALNFVTHLF